MTTHAQYIRTAVSWAAQTITMAGAVLHSHDEGWDVELPDGSWMAANSWQELCAIARSFQI